MENIKKCSSCEESKSVDSFRLRKDTGKRRNKCIGCEKLYFAEHYAKKPDKLEKHRQDYQNNKKACKERVKKWKKDNPDKVKASYELKKKRVKEAKQKEKKLKLQRELELKEKVCKKCKINKSIDNFYFRNDSKKYQNFCKNCVNGKNRKYQEENSEKLKKYLRNYTKKYEKENRSKLNTKERNLRKNNINYRISSNLRSRISKLIKLKNNKRSGSAVRDLGCSVEELRQYLENKFYINIDTKEVMSWKNYGKYGWHIDHIKPLSSFDLTDRKQLLKACHYTNLQPLWAKDNLSKGARTI